MNLIRKTRRGLADDVRHKEGGRVTTVESTLDQDDYDEFGLLHANAE
jgi:hypothetical protein